MERVSEHELRGMQETEQREREEMRSCEEVWMQSARRYKGKKEGLQKQFRVFRVRLCRRYAEPYAIIDNSGQ